MTRHEQGVERYINTALYSHANFTYHTQKTMTVVSIPLESRQKSRNTNRNHGFPGVKQSMRLVAFFLLLWCIAAAFTVTRQAYLSALLLSAQNNTIPAATSTANPTKILYIVTSMAEFDNGQRNTLQGRDRYKETLIPLVSEAVASMISFGYTVDLYLITHYELTPDRQLLLRNAVPPTVGLQVWDDATPLGYAPPKNNNEQDGLTSLQPISNALARQHRLVIKDKFLEYDLFVNFEDDMLVNGHHVQHYLSMTEEIHRLKRSAPGRTSATTALATPRDPRQRLQQAIRPIDQFYGNLTKIQLARLFPGFIRVEVVSEQNQHDFNQGRSDVPISVLRNQTFNKLSIKTQIDPKPCCHKGQANSTNLLSSVLEVRPRIDDIFLWETATIALGLHRMPASSSLDWVFLQRGVDQIYLQRDKIIGEYWTGTNLSFTNEIGDTEQPPERPNPTHPKYINNQGGWMATPEQLYAWHGHCNNQNRGPPVSSSSLLPPFDDGTDGLKNNVEFWSGGISFVGMNTCQLQRIVSLQPDDFSKHLIYHTSNNKQKSKNLAFTNVQTFWDELYSVQLEAEAVIPVAQ